MVCTGNENIHRLTADRRQVLRVDLRDAEGHTRFAEYDRFEVKSALTNYYLLKLGSYAGDAGQCGTET